MKTLRRLWNRIAGTFTRSNSRGDSELSAEFETHITFLTEKNIQRGMSPQEARRAAILTFGAVEPMKENYRDARTLPFLDSLWQDLRFAVRMLRKSPAFTAIAIVTLALGIGANTAIFTVANTLLLQPLPFSDPGRLVLVARTLATDHTQPLVFSYQRFQDLQQNSSSFSGIASFVNESFNLTGHGDPEQVPAARVSGDFFGVLGAKFALGRSFLPEEEVAGGPNVAIISREFWHDKFASDPNILGRTVDLDSRNYTIVGVLPPGFTFAFLGSNIRVWTTRVFELNSTTPQQVENGAGFLTAVARLKPGVTIQQAQSEMNVRTTQFHAQRPTWPDGGANAYMDVSDLQKQAVANFRPAILMLFGAVGVVLLIACANVASLLLSRALARRKEIAVRTAMGAARGALIRQLLTESLLLAAIAGAVGIAVGEIAIHFLTNFVDQNVALPAALHLDWRVLLFTAAISVFSGALFGLMPSLQVSKVDLNRVLRDEGRGASVGHARGTLRSVLVVAQIALSMVLLIGCGLLIRSFVRLVNENPGFDAKNVLTMQLSLSPVHYPNTAQMIPFFNSLVAALRALPGIQQAALCSALPVNPTRFSPILPEDQPQVALPLRPVVNVQSITSNYLGVLHVPLLRGREFTEQDDAQSPSVVIVNHALAAQYWPNTNPIGKHIWLGRRPNPAQIVGVIGDVKNLTLATPASPEVFVPYSQLPWGFVNIAVRTNVAPHSLIATVRQQVTALDPTQSVTNALTLDEVLQAGRVQQRFLMILLAIFAGTAFLLAAIGIYGVIAYSVTQRTRELGVRIALGAPRAAILRLVLAQGLKLAIAGIFVGALIAIAATRVLAAQLYQVGAMDPITFIASSILFMGVAALACGVPARRAMRVDPLVALRHE